VANTTHKAYSQAATTILSTELNSLANVTFGTTSAAIDNSSALDLYADFELTIATQGVARSTGANCVLYMSIALDGTNYSDISQTTTPEVLVTFPLDAATTSRIVTRRDIPIPPSATFKVSLYNNTGQAFAASGNTVKYRFHSIQTV
jgi:hypothetical protein